MDESDLIVSSTEIIEDKLYFATFAVGYKPKSTRNSKYFHIEDDIVYESFFYDFGPYHLCHLAQFCRKLNKELADAPKNKKIVFCTSDVETLRLNAAYLIGSYAIIYLGKSPTWAHSQLTENCNWNLLKFRDASDGPMLFDISLLDVLQGLHIAHKAGFFDFDDFNKGEYLYYEEVENGDLNWIIPQKMLAFSGPHARPCIDRGYQHHSPEHYHQYFKENNVTTIVRLNKERYDARQFTAHGFEHHDLFFVDGSAPTDGIVNRFIKICEAAPGAVAVHCKAGLGRTGTLIGCYMMRFHGFTARQAIAWLRICRPGSVIGLQQVFMEKVQARMFAEGEAYRKRHSITSFPVFKQGVYSFMLPETLTSERENIENKANDNSIYIKEKPVSLNTILNSVGNTSINNNPIRATRKIKKEIVSTNCNAMLNSGNRRDPENNATGLNVLKKRPANPILVTAEAGYIPKMNFMMPTNNIRNANSTNLKVSTRPKAARPAAAIPAFPQTFSSLISLSKLQSAKSSIKPMQRSSVNLKTYQRKNSNLSYNRVITTQHGANNNGTSVITTLTENCSLDAKNGNILDVNVPVTRAIVKTVTNGQQKSFLSDTSLRKKNFVRSVSVVPKKQTKNNNTMDDLNSNLDLSGSDTTVANLSVDSLEATPATEHKVRRKQDKSKSSEATFSSNRLSIDKYEEATNPQGNKLYKIKAMRERPALTKRDLSKPRTGNSARKK